MPRSSRVRNGWLFLLGGIGLLLLFGATLTGADDTEADQGDRLGQRIYITQAGDEPDQPLVPVAEPVDFVLPEPKNLAPTVQFATAADAPATIIVTYHGFSPEARQSMQSAVQVWAEHLSSPVPIRIDAYWEDLGRGVLGASGPLGFWRNVAGAPADGLYRPSALANRYARRDLDPAVPDMIVYLNSTGIHWYFGTDGKPPVATYDLFTIALHEVSHGLGIADSGDAGYSDNDEILGTFDGPFVLDSLLYSEDGTQLIGTQYPSNELYRLFTSGRLYYDGPQTRIATANARARVFAPLYLYRGSSLSHLDESVYPDGDPNALLTPYISSREVIHEPGPILLALLADIGWGAAVGPALETPTPTATPYAIRRFAAQVASDGWRKPTGTPTAVSTQAPRPAPTMVAPPNPDTVSVGILNATWRIDENGYLWVVGEIGNSRSTPIGYVVVDVFYYDKLGHRIGGSYGSTPFPFIAPGDVAPFRSGNSEPPPGVTMVTLSVAYVDLPGDYTPPTGLEVTITSQTLSAIGVLHIRGSVENTSASQTWEQIVPVTALYGTSGRVLLVEALFLAPTSLAPGETGTFDWAIDNPPAPGTIGAIRTWIGTYDY